MQFTEIGVRFYILSKYLKFLVNQIVWLIDSCGIIFMQEILPIIQKE